MKRLALFLAIVLPMAVLAQKSPVDNLFEKYANQKGITTVNISGKLLGFAGNITFLNKWNLSLSLHNICLEK